MTAPLPRADATPQVPQGEAVPGAPLIDVQQVTRRYPLARQGLWEPRRMLTALDKVSLTVHKGRTLGVVGESGSGKSTLTRCLLGLEPVDGGRILYRGADIAVHGWRLQRRDGPARWSADLAARGFALQFDMTPTQPLLLQGEAGFSRKGPQEAQASHYLSEPQLAVAGQLRRGGRAQAVQGRAWLDHEWSDELLHPQAVGWDWIGMNLDDGSALTAFRLRRADGSALWAGGSFRRAGQVQAQDFPPEAVVFEPGRRWRSPTSGGDYPVAWTVRTPAGRFTVQALLDAQELDSRSSTGTVYWEGLSELRDVTSRRTGLGYLEMTGYAGRLVL
jgi:energy-coupling factor transporter ATP-binding protein EcfA2